MRPPPPKNNVRPLKGRKRIIVAGSRDFTDKKFVWDHLTRLLEDLRDPIILHGGARGVDRLAGLWAGYHWLLEQVFHPDYKTHGPKLAPIMRNKEMADNGDALICFWDGVSPGSRNMIDEARKRSLKVKVVRIDHDE